MQKKIAFIRKGIVPIANTRVAEYLQERFPDLKLEVIDITSLLKAQKLLFVQNAFFTLVEFAPDIILGKKKAKECFWRTKFLFDKIKALMMKRLDPDEYLFSFQMQSLFDASVPDIPHFVYTDHTNLANLSYPLVNLDEMYPERTIELERLIYQNATQVFTRSHNITRSIVQEYGCDPNKVECVYAGSNTQVTSPRDIRPKNLNYSNKHILFVGIDWERKGGPELIEAFKIVLQQHPDATLTIIGSTPEIDVPNVKVLGRVPIEALNCHYQSASLFCMPTKLEPFGIVFIEALSFKLPIIGTNIGAIPDFIVDGQNGYLVPPNNVDQLAEALLRLVGDPERSRQFGEAGYQLSLEKYNWDKVSKRMEKHIRETLGVTAA